MNQFSKDIRKHILCLGFVMGLIFGSNKICAGAASNPFSISESSLTLKVNESRMITIKSNNKSVAKMITFMSSDKKIAAVTKKGKITAKKAGKAVINVNITYKKGKKTATVTLKCKIQVTKKQPVVYNAKQKKALQQMIKNCWHGAGTVLTRPFSWDI